MGALEKGLKRFEEKQAAEEAAQLADLEARKKQAGALMQVLAGDAELCKLRLLRPKVDGAAVVIDLDGEELARISPVAAGDSFEIRIGGRTNNFQGDAEACIEMLGELLGEHFKRVGQPTRRPARHYRPSGGWQAS